MNVFPYAHFLSPPLQPLSQFADGGQHQVGLQGKAKYDHPDEGEIWLSQPEANLTKDRFYAATPIPGDLEHKFRFQYNNKTTS